jgi:hypothetical protein
MKAGVKWLIRLFGVERAREVARAYRQALAKDSPEARLVLADLAQYCRVGATSFVPNDPHQTAFNEGARDVYLHVCEMAGLRPDDFPKTMERPEHD